jgi:mono/diheme cytochrome c family protein
MRRWAVTPIRRLSGRRLRAMGMTAVALAAAAVGAFAAYQAKLIERLSGWGSARQPGLVEGRALYSQYCARCHGANLEGQPNWQRRLPSGRLPAPPHDASGHTWHHSDRTLFDITKKGTAAVVGGGYESDMPGFEGVLSDDQIRSVLAFIKSTWPERERRFQERVSQGDREAQR